MVMGVVVPELELFGPQPASVASQTGQYSDGTYGEAKN